MVTQQAMDFLVGGLNPCEVEMPPPPPPPERRHKNTWPGVRTNNPWRHTLLHYHSTGSCTAASTFPTAWSLLSENF